MKPSKSQNSDQNREPRSSDGDLSEECEEFIIPPLDPAVIPRIYSPWLLDPNDEIGFTKEIVEVPPDGSNENIDTVDS